MHTACARMGPLIHTEERTPGMCVGTGRGLWCSQCSAGGQGCQGESAEVYLQLQGGGEISNNRLEVVCSLSLGVCKREGHMSQGL